MRKFLTVGTILLVMFLTMNGYAEEKKKENKRQLFFGLGAGPFYLDGTHHYRNGADSGPNVSILYLSRNGKFFNEAMLTLTDLSDIHFTFNWFITGKRYNSAEGKGLLKGVAKHSLSLIGVYAGFGVYSGFYNELREGIDNSRKSFMAPHLGVKMIGCFIHWDIRVYPLPFIKIRDDSGWRFEFCGPFTASLTLGFMF